MKSKYDKTLIKSIKNTPVSYEQYNLQKIKENKNQSFTQGLIFLEYEHA